MGSDSFTDGAPASDDDPYSSSSAKASYNIDRKTFAKPMPVIGSLMGYDDKFFAMVSRRKIEHASAQMQRPLTSDEASAMAYWAAKQISILSYSTPIGIAAGAWRCWDTRARYRFPFFGPNMATFNPLQFPNGAPVLTGARASLVWHVFRALTYIAVGKFASSTLVGSYAMTVAAVGEMKDPRLKDFREKLMSDVQARKTGRVGPGTGNPQPLPQQAGRQQVEQVEGTSEGTQHDDASPSGGMFFDQATGSGRPPVNTDERATDNIQPESRRPSRWSQSPQTTSESEDRPFSAFDDASPTSGQGSQGDTESSSPPPGSAWDRVRSEQKPLPQTQKRQSSSWQNQPSQTPRENAWAKQRNNAQNEDSSDEYFTKSSSQEEKKYSREEAQREFDARVERERKGGDFAASSGDQKRW